MNGMSLCPGLPENLSPTLIWEILSRNITPALLCVCKPKLMVLISAHAGVEGRCSCLRNGNWGLEEDCGWQSSSGKTRRICQDWQSRKLGCPGRCSPPVRATLFNPPTHSLHTHPFLIRVRSCSFSLSPSVQQQNNRLALDACAVRIWLDRKVVLPRPSNACSGFDEGVGWTFFDLTALHDEFRDSPTTVLEADFYHAATLLPMSDDELVNKVPTPARPA